MRIPSRAAGAPLVALLLWSSFTGNAQTPRSLILRGAVWKYWAEGSTPGAYWKTSSFSDAAWASGPAPLGYGRGDEATVIGAGAALGPTTIYFRYSLVLTNTTPFQTVTLNVMRDDGAV